MHVYKHFKFKIINFSKLQALEMLFIIYKSLSEISGFPDVYVHKTNFCLRRIESLTNEGQNCLGNNL